jgi:hypothetical protein
MSIVAEQAGERSPDVRRGPVRVRRSPGTAPQTSRSISMTRLALGRPFSGHWGG